MMAGVKQNAVQKFPWSLSFRFYDLTAVYQLSAAVLAKVELQDPKTAGAYTGFLVSVVNKTTGVVDKKFFEFDDYMREVAKNTNPAAAKGFFLWREASRLEWYIKHPDEAAYLAYVKTIEDYILEFDAGPNGR